MGIVPQLPLEGILVLRYCALVTVLVSLLFPLRAAAPDSGLKGLSELGVVVGNPGAEARRAGLTEVQLRQDVELKLKQNGLRVVDGNQSLGIYLELRANCVYLEQTRSFVYSVSLFFRQPVILKRQPETAVSKAATWGGAVTGIAPEAKLGANVRETTAELVDDFLKAYLVENPKK
jgi:hypothetical protein